MKNIGIYIYNEAEVLDFAGPFEVFSVASRFLDENEKIDYQNMFCDYVSTNALQKSEIIAISDVESYGQMSGKNLFIRN